MSELINNTIVHYRDDLDLQNLIDFGQKEVWTKGVVSAQPVVWEPGSKVSAIPREASPSRPVDFFIPWQGNGFWEGVGRKTIHAECYKSIFKGTEQYRW